MSTMTDKTETQPFVVLEADYHRNGMSGEGFFVGIIGNADETRKLVTFFPEYEEGGETLAKWQTRIAVINLDVAAEGNIYMHPVGDHRGGNAWRGDRYAHAALAIMEAVNARYES